MHLILPSSDVPSDSIALAKNLVARGLDGVWTGERAGEDAPARLASLAATVQVATLGLGPLPLTERTTAQVGETLTTANLLAPGRVRLAFELPRTVGDAIRPSWASLLDDLAAVVRAADLPMTVAAPDDVSALLAAGAVDRIVLRGVDVGTTRRLVDALRRGDHATQVEVWLDAGDPETLRPVVAERLVVPGVPGGSLLRSLVRRHHPGLQGRIDRAYAVGALDEAAAAVPDDLVRATCLIGPAEEISRRVDDYAAAGAIAVGVRPHGPDTDARVAAAGVVADAVQAA